MIKIEFNKPLRGHFLNELPDVKTWFFEPKSASLRIVRGLMMNDVKHISFGCVSELVQTREQVLSQLGISKEQDEEFQLKYKNI